LIEEMPLFATAGAGAGGAAEPSPLEALLAETDPDALTPREALALLYHLKALMP
jgi:DNA mismatch repair protein MutS